MNALVLAPLQILKWATARKLVGPLAMSSEQVFYELCKPGMN
jgi:hypothetical protein